MNWTILFFPMMPWGRDGPQFLAEQSHHAPQCQRPDSGADLQLQTPQRTGRGSWESVHGNGLSHHLSCQPAALSRQLAKTVMTVLLLDF